MTYLSAGKLRVNGAQNQQMRAVLELVLHLLPPLVGFAVPVSCDSICGDVECKATSIFVGPRRLGRCPVVVPLSWPRELKALATLSPPRLWLGLGTHASSFHLSLSGRGVFLNHAHWLSDK